MDRQIHGWMQDVANVWMDRRTDVGMNRQKSASYGCIPAISPTCLLISLSGQLAAFCLVSLHQAAENVVN